MSELVTSTSGVSQFGLFAPRQQAFGIERSTSAPDAAAVIEGAKDSLHNVQPSVPAARHDDTTPSSSLAVQEGPSRARVEIRAFDPGLTSSAGTSEALPRFDNSSDGPINLPDSGNATAAQQQFSTFAAAGDSAPAPQSTAPAIYGESAAQTAIVPTEDEVPGEPKQFSVPLAPDGRPEPKKFTDTTAAAEGAHTVAVEKKFYDKSAEVVGGQAVTAHAAPAANIHDRMAALKQQGVIREDDTPETRLYDKVSQSERQHQQQSGDHASGGSNPSLHERARQVAEAINGAKKTVFVQLSAYTDTAAAGTKQAAILVETTDVTA